MVVTCESEELGMKTQTLHSRKKIDQDPEKQQMCCADGS